MIVLIPILIVRDDGRYNAGTAQDEEKQRAARKKGKRRPNAPVRPKPPLPCRWHLGCILLKIAAMLLLIGARRGE